MDKRAVQRPHQRICTDGNINIWCSTLYVINKLWIKTMKQWNTMTQLL